MGYIYTSLFLAAYIQSISQSNLFYPLHVFQINLLLFSPITTSSHQDFADSLLTILFMQYACL